ncbi:hypothetical protein EDB85DRAFT_1902073 [Lactarius pseudohatsudake]|nr:hypothetical protein EDB85DRAFT_1902073 [Lactarius pseudohatsudake]
MAPHSSNKPNPTTELSIAATNAQLESITSGKEFSLHDVQDEDNPPASDPSGQSPALAPTKSVTSKAAAIDLAHFFTEVDFPDATKDNKKVQKVCKICTNGSNYFYSKTTGNTNLRRHLMTHHTKAYNSTILEHGWHYKLSTQSEDPSAHKNTRKLCNPNVAFEPLEYPHEEDSHAYSITTKEELLDWLKNSDQMYRDSLMPLDTRIRLLVPVCSSSSSAPCYKLNADFSSIILDFCITVASVRPLSLSKPVPNPSRIDMSRRNVTPNLPSFSLRSFLDHLVNFIVADDQAHYVGMTLQLVMLYT